jgi:hypothetical protein
MSNELVSQLAEQLDWHWTQQLRPRLDGLTDADAALQQLDDQYAAWSTGVKGLTGESLWRECGPAEGPFTNYPFIALVLHINREVIHHGAEIALLRDLYAHTTNREN